ncbi:MAG: M20/M25/M40 family metallo-hydrolase [Parachlamydiales bacterium]
MEKLSGLEKRLKRWCEISSWSHDPAGLKVMQEALSVDFAPLDADQERLGCGLIFRKRPSAPLQIYLGGHYDTYHQTGWPVREEGGRLYGPGVADMKGGLVILLEALTRLEAQGGERVGWRVVLNGDEELGSPKSRPVIEEVAKGCHLALLFEPALPDGALINERKGSANYRIGVKGRAAHAGRDPEAGRSATHALIALFADLPAGWNVGKIEGGEALNGVAESASALLNIRYEAPFDLAGRIAHIEKSREVAITCETLSDRPPKPISAGTEQLMGIIERLDPEVRWQKTGGVCDGNLVAAQGVPCLDTLGVVGGGLHTAEEYCVRQSLVERSRLAGDLLCGLNIGEIEWESV